MPSPFLTTSAPHRQCALRPNHPVHGVAIVVSRARRLGATSARAGALTQREKEGGPRCP